MIGTRRVFLQAAGSGIAALALGSAQIGDAQPPAGSPGATKLIQTPILTIGYEETGDSQGFPIILLHGFPDDVRAWDDVAPPLVKAGYRVLVPYLRGFGATRFRDAAAPRTGEQAAIGQDLIDFADALHIQRFAVAGFDWGARAGQVAAALHPGRVRAACFSGGYSIQNTVAQSRPGSPQSERLFWYQWYFNLERGREGLTANRRAFCRLLWETWSPEWHFIDETYNRTAPSFDNPDFVDVVIHSYRHRTGTAPGEERFKESEQLLAKRPKIEAPTILLHGAADALNRPPAGESPAQQALFPSLKATRVVAGAGHFLPREKPGAMSSALLELLAGAA
jgi:pimeloyl-ACP methyl ester carboxylesterase